MLPDATCLEQIVASHKCRLLTFTPNPADRLHDGAALHVQCAAARGEQWWIKFDRSDLVGASTRLDAEILKTVRPALSPTLIGTGWYDDRHYMITRHINGVTLEEYLADAGDLDAQGIASWLAEFRKSEEQVLAIRSNLAMPLANTIPPSQYRDAILCHGSFEPSNLIVDSEKGTLIGVIDFEASCLASAAWDSATMLARLAMITPPAAKTWARFLGPDLPSVLQETRIILERRSNVDAEGTDSLRRWLAHLDVDITNTMIGKRN